MRRIRTARASPALVIALFVALRGVSYAALRLPKNSVGSTQIKADAVRSSKVNGSLLSSDFKANQLPRSDGPRRRGGAQGEKGAPGDKGSPSEKADVGPSNVISQRAANS